ncbi:MAG: hypothetical protein IID44_25070 [Planctomycetes bacterium]|nr:hypothetical protein [Planctomycetota bacterium]
MAIETANPTLGPIQANVAYPLADFLKRAGLGEWAWRSARKNATKLGITLRRQHGSSVWVLGSDWIKYLGSEVQED